MGVIINYYEARGRERNVVEKGQRCVVAYANGDEAKFILQPSHRMNWSRRENEKSWIIYRSQEYAFRQARHYQWNHDRLREVGSIPEARKFLREYCDEHLKGLGVEEQKRRAAKVAYLPGGENKDFYPTPSRIAGKMIACVDWKRVRDILEPSAGKGDLVDAVTDALLHSAKLQKETCYDLKNRPEKFFDVIELDYNLRLILRGRGLRLVGDDFLQYRTQKRYDLVIMNPPFSNGAAHLLHAIELQKNGGQIVCLLNAETIRNPYTKERKLLQSLLTKYEARIEFISDGFRQAERKTDVEIAMIYLDIPRVRMESTILEGAKKAVEQEWGDQRQEENQIVIADEILSLIEYFNVEAKAGVDFLLMYDALVPHIMDGDPPYEKPLISIEVDGTKHGNATNETINDYLRKLRYKYWNLLLNKPQLREKMTSQMDSDYRDKLRDMADYDFNRHNVMQVFYDIQLQLQQGVEDSIMALFSKLSEEYAWSKEINNDNVHYYNGWATNKAWKVGMKVILPINGFSSYSWEKDKLDQYDVAKTISDLERSLTYLDKGEIGWQRDPYHVINMANTLHTTRQELAFTYFSAKFYKKGTCHIKFRKEAAPILDRLNIFAARKRSWLPPSYGRKKYADMDEKEREVIDSFQGEEEYAKVMENPSMYVIEAAQLRPMLTN